MPDVVGRNEFGSWHSYLPTTINTLKTYLHGAHTLISLLNTLFKAFFVHCSQCSGLEDGRELIFALGEFLALRAKPDAHTDHG